MSNVEVRLRVESNLKKEAEKIYKNMGMSISEAIRIFLHQSVNSSALPFRPHLKVQNKETMQAFDEVNKGEFEQMSGDDFNDYLKEQSTEDN